MTTTDGAGSLRSEKDCSGVASMDGQYGQIPIGRAFSDWLRCRKSRPAPSRAKVCGASRLRRIDGCGCAEDAGANRGIVNPPPPPRAKAGAPIPVPTRLNRAIVGSQTSRMARFLGRSTRNVIPVRIDVNVLPQSSWLGVSGRASTRVRAPMPAPVAIGGPDTPGHDGNEESMSRRTGISWP
jgi:hypothetical protein